MQSFTSLSPSPLPLRSKQQKKTRKAIASTGNPTKAAVSAGAVLTPGRYTVVPTCTGCISGDDRGKGQSAAAKTKGTGHASETKEGQAGGEGADINGGVEKNEGQKGEERDGEDGDGGDEGKGEEMSASSFDRRDVLAALGDMFDDLDADCDGVLAREEVKERMG